MNEEKFARSVLSWYDKGHRDLPWRHTTDAYRIWISEIMLQQTRAETVVSYYERFLAHYPTVYALAEAEEAELLKCWEGLGYYSRARSLQKAAKIIVSVYGGVLPRTVQELQKLPGIGTYTAGAIASIAYGVPAPAVDGNVERVLCRYEAITLETGTPAARKAIAARAEAFVPTDRPGTFTNAMIEMGATMCTPRNPSCLICPVRESCKGYAQGIAQNLPVKPKKKAPRVENRCVLLVFCKKHVLITRREERLLGGLHVFPDMMGEPSPAEMCAYLETLGVFAAYDAPQGHARHVFTHLIWEMDIHAFEADSCVDVTGGQWVDADQLHDLAMPTAVKAAREIAMKRLCG